MDRLAPSFIVGTGRCGSTLLSRLLVDHPSLLSLSEVFSLLTDLGGRIAACFEERPLGGDEFWGVLGSTPPKLATMLRHGVAMEEVLCRPGPSARYSVLSGVPALLQTALPLLSSEPETVFEQLERYVSTLSVAPFSDQYRLAFAWLCRHFGKVGWVERSGGSLRVVARLRKAFPEARFVHLVRDGRTAALSMSRHRGFKMALAAAQLTEILGVDPYESTDRSFEGDLPDELIPFLPERFDAAAFEAWETPLALCGHYWSGEIVAGLSELEGLPTAQLLTLRYEDLLREPTACLARISAFLGCPAREWAARHAQSVRSPRSSFASLVGTARRELEDACAPGFAALGALYEERE